MGFADLKNDVIFKRVFAAHPEILRRLLNDVLERQGEQEIVEIEYLASEQVPLVEGGKLSIPDIRCRERGGRIFIVEMQLLHIRGFQSRVIFNASRAYVEQIRRRERYTKLRDVITISICNFELWPASPRAPAPSREGVPQVPMLSRWSMSEHHSGLRDLGQIQHIFLELPKLPPERPTEPGAALWAWLFAHGHELEDIPSDIPSGPYRDAVELANEATLSAEEQAAYRRLNDEINLALDYGDDRELKGELRGELRGKRAGILEGELRGKRVGILEGKREALLSVLAARGLALDPDALARLHACDDLDIFDRWLARALSAAAISDLFAD